MFLPAVVWMIWYTSRATAPQCFFFLTWTKNNGSGLQSALWRRGSLFSFSLVFRLSPGLKLLPNMFVVQFDGRFCRSNTSCSLCLFAINLSYMGKWHDKVYRDCSSNGSRYHSLHSENGSKYELWVLFFFLLHKSLSLLSKIILSNIRIGCFCFVVLFICAAHSN